MHKFDLLRPKLRPKYTAETSPNYLREILVKNWPKKCDLILSLNFKITYSFLSFASYVLHLALLNWPSKPVCYASHSSRLILLLCAHLQHSKLTLFSKLKRKLNKGYLILYVLSTYEGVRFIVLSVALETVFTKVMKLLSCNSNNSLDTYCLKQKKLLPHLGLINKVILQ